MFATPAHATSLAFLLSQVGAQSARLFGEMLASSGVSPRSYGILAGLSVADGKTQQRLADELGIHRNNMVAAIDELEAAGWVRRDRDPKDRRAFNIRMTDAGRDVVARVELMLPQLDDRVAGGLDTEQRGELIRVLGTLADGLGLRPGVHPALSSFS